MQNSEFRMQNAEFRVQNAEFRIQNDKDSSAFPTDTNHAAGWKKINLLSAVRNFQL